jgi:poly(3-hydroxybutyrate) depolymerase
MEPTLKSQPTARENARAGMVPPGRIVRRLLTSDKKTVYYIYRSTRLQPDLPVMVSVHGIQRRADLQASLFAPLIEAIGGILVAPLFSRPRYDDYQRLGRHGRGDRSDLTLKAILSEQAMLTGVSARSIVLFGYSGGGQFVHRFAMAHPRQVSRMAIAASGWYTFPDRRRSYPEGIGTCGDLPDLFLDPARFLQIPTLVLVGEFDTTRDPNLNRRGKLDVRQGMNRLERGRNWIEAMGTAAARYNYDTHFSFKVVPGCGHSFPDCMTTGDMGRQVISFLFSGCSRPTHPFDTGRTLSIYSTDAKGEL